MKKIKVWKVLLSILLVIVLILGVYVAYVFIDYSRVEDNLALEVDNNQGGVVEVSNDYTLMSYNIGFGAYEPDYSFFMDGGKYARAFSKERLLTNMNNINEFILQQDSDFVILQEVDEKATRTYQVNEREMISDALSSYGNIWAENWDSPYLFWPLIKPHGKTLAGQMTFSKTKMDSSVRRSLPIEKGFMKLVDLDRCYSITRIPTDDGKELVLINVHLSAYTSDGLIADEQTKLLLEEIQAEYDKGNYVICGGDFNKDLLGDSSAVFGVDGSDYTWAQAFKVDLLEGKDFELYAPVDNHPIIPTSRVADAPYSSEQFVVTLDGFIVSSNVKVKKSMVLDGDFLYSDHNPIELTFELIKEK